MTGLLKADIYRVRKNRLTLVALILALGFPVLTVLLYAGIRLAAGGGDDPALDMVLNANAIIGSVYSLTNNIGLAVPAFAGILVCTDYTNGTLRNKVIAGNRRWQIYLSHLTVAVLFSVAVITLYAAVTAGLALLFFPFAKDPSVDLGKEILRFAVNGTLSFVFMASFSTMLAMTLRSIAPTIIFTIVFAMLLLAVTSVIQLVDYERYRYAVYLIPTFAGNFSSLSELNLAGLLGRTASAPLDTIFAEGVLSYLFFSAVHTAIGMWVFTKRDVK